MKLAFFALATLVAVTLAQNPAYITVPSSGATLKAGQNVTLQLVQPYTHGGQPGTEIGMVISIEHCELSGCAAPEHVQEILYTGKYEFETHPDRTEPYQNFTLAIRPTMGLGAAQIKVARFLVDMGGNSALTFNMVNVTISESQPNTKAYNVHPNDDTKKCIGVLGGQNAYANGTPVDIYDCDNSVTQKWQWIGGSLVSVKPKDQAQWCLDAGVENNLANGVKMKIWKCYTNLGQQTWTPITTLGQIKLSVGGYCLDLTDGKKDNRNVLQIWKCVAGNTNQIWSFTAAA